jgi:hypothetical protein
VRVPGECPLLLLSCVRLPLILTVRISVRLQELGCDKPSLPPVLEDAVDRAVRRVAAEKKEKKDAEKARARERMRARDALERRRRRQEKDGLPMEPSPEMPDDDDDDDDDEDDDMAACLGLSPDLRLGQGSSSQPLSGLAPLVPGAGTSGSRSEEQGQAEGVLDPLAEVVEVTPGSRANLPVSQERLLVPAKNAGVAAALSPPDALPAPAPASAEAVAVLPVEPPVAADAGMAKVPLLEVVSDLPSLCHKEGAATVAEVGDWKPTSLAEVVPDASTAGGPDALEEGCAEPRPILGSDDLIPVRHDPNERRGQALRFWTCGASKPLFVLDDEREEQSRDELREYAEAAMGSLRSTMEILSRDVPRVLQVRVSGIPFA